MDVYYIPNICLVEGKNLWETQKKILNILKQGEQTSIWSKQKYKTEQNKQTKQKKTNLQAKLNTCKST